MVRVLMELITVYPKNHAEQVPTVWNQIQCIFKVKAGSVI